MAYCYFKPVDSLPDPKGPLSKTFAPSIIHSTNEEAKQVYQSDAVAKSLSKRGSYATFFPEQQAKVANYASMNRVAADLKTDLKESTVCTWKMKYLKELR